MKQTHYANFVLCITLVLFAQNIFANDYAQWKLPAGVKARLGKGRILDIAYSPAGDRFAIVTPIGIWVYDAESGIEVMLLVGEGFQHIYSFRRMKSVAFSPDGRTIAGGGLGRIELWDVYGGHLIQTITVDRIDFIASLAFSPDGETIAAGRDDGILILNVRTGKIVLTIKETYTDSITSVAFSPDGGMLVSTGRDDSTIQVWNVHTGEHVRTLFGHTEEVNSVAFSSDGHTLASASDDDTIGLWSILTGKLKQTVSEHDGNVTSVAFVPGGHTLASVSFSKILLWNVRTAEQVNIRFWPYEEVQSIVFSPDGDTLVSGDINGLVHQWDVHTTTKIRTIEGHTPSVSSMAFSPHEFTLASGSGQVDTIRLWDTSSGRKTGILDGYWGPVTSLAFSPNGITLASSSSNSDHVTFMLDQHKPQVGVSQHTLDPLGIWLWDIRTGQRTLPLGLKSHGAEGMAFSPDGKRLASANIGIDGVIIWDVRTGEEVTTLEWQMTGRTARQSLADRVTSRVTSFAFSPGGEILASGHNDGTIRLWDASTGKRLQTYKGHKAPVNSVAFSPDGGTLASGSGHGFLDDETTVRLWDIGTSGNKTPRKGRTWRRLSRFLKIGSGSQILKGHTDAVNSVVYSPNGMILASGSGDRTVRLWDPHDGRHLRTLEGHIGSVTSIAIRPDEHTLASGSEDGTILLWNLSLEEKNK